MWHSLRLKHHIHELVQGTNSYHQHAIRNWDRITFFAFLLYRLGLALEEDYQPFPWAHECDAVSFDFNRPVYSFSISSVLHFSNSVPFKTVSVDKSLRQLENTTFLRLILGSLFPVVLHNLKPSSCKLSVTRNHLFLPMKSVSKYTTP